MDVQQIFAIIFLFLLSLFAFVKRKKIHVQKILYPFIYFLMYRTSIGLKFMDNTAKRFPKFLKRVGYFGIFIGFAGMLLLAFELIRNLIKILTTPEAMPGVGLVLPVEVKGAFYVPFFYWIISIFVLAVVHEFSHGIFARLYGLKIKSSGFAALAILIPILPAAFVEPDEKDLKKKKAKEQLSIFAAGPFANIVFALFVLLMFVLFVPLVISSVVEFNGVEILETIDGFPAQKAGISEGEIIKGIDDVEVKSVVNFTNLLSSKNPGDSILLKTDKDEYDVVLGENPEFKERGYLGVSVSQSSDVKKEFAGKYGKIFPAVILWFVGLMYWLYLLNLGIGLFNLVPVGPIDGGRMVHTVLLKYFDKEKADKYWKIISVFFLLLIIVNIGVAFF